MQLIAGVSPKTVAARLGHTDPRMTMRIYSHVVPELGREAADQINAVLTRKPARGPRKKVVK